MYAIRSYYVSISDFGDLGYTDEDGIAIPLGQKIGLFKFSNRQALEAVGGNLYRENSATGVPVLDEELGKRSVIRKGFLEASVITSYSIHYTKLYEKAEIFDYVNIFLMTIIMFIMVYPMWYIIVGAFNEGADYARGGVYFWARKLTIENFQAIFYQKAILQAFWITILKT